LNRHLFHGSRVCNWLGIIFRGLLMPKTVVGLGGQLTDGGNLGSGIYFANSPQTARFYVDPDCFAFISSFFLLLSSFFLLPFFFFFFFFFFVVIFFFFIFNLIK